MRSSINIPQQTTLSRMQSPNKGLLFSYNNQPSNPFSIKKYINSFEKQNTYKPTNLDQYQGGLERQRPKGLGTYKFKSLEDNQRKYYAYTGNFQNGQFNGFGMLWQADGQDAYICYIGDWKNGKRDGFGLQIYQRDGKVRYQGNWRDDQRSEQGRLEFLDGVYQGSWDRGKMNGKGKLILQKNAIITTIQGDWANDDIRSGKIKYYSREDKNHFNPLATYEGKIRYLMRDGQGVYQQKQLRFEGLFSEDDLINAALIRGSINNGELQYTIRGNFNKNGFDNAIATILYKNGDRYEGSVIFENGVVLRKKGKYYFSDGQVVQGQFQDNQVGKLILRSKFT